MEGLPRPAPPDISLEEFASSWRRRFGLNNPDPMPIPFWEKMVRWGGDGFWIAEGLGHDSFKEGPVWCYSRLGTSMTIIDDQWVVSIGGEHEDWYDPDFLIYNDVIVRSLNGDRRIFGYPKGVFPPTDFHTATLTEIDGSPCIVIIGGLGYPEGREFWRTPIYALELDRFSIRPCEGKGDEPGWLFKHEARLVDLDTIRVWGGSRIDEEGGIVRNDATFDLDLRSMTWTRR